MRKIYLFLIFVVGLTLNIQTFAEGLSISPLRFEFNVDKGTTKSEKVKITNSSSKSITIYSNSEDFVSGDDKGTPKFVTTLEQTSQEFTLSNWIKIEQSNITLAPNETQEVNFNINVPNNAEPGGHYAAIFFGPGAEGGAQVAVVQRLGVLILVNVSGEVKIAGDVTGFEIGSKDKEGKFSENSTFKDFPINFKTTFENTGNTHLKPTGKITLKDENGEIIKNIGKETLSTKDGAYIGEKAVDYLPINDTESNVLPKSKRLFENIWEGFGYIQLNEDGTKTVKFKTPEEYYKDLAAEKNKTSFIMPWQKVKTKNVDKKITAYFELSYEGKDKVKKDFNKTNEFIVSYPVEYIGINPYFLIIFIILIGGGGYYFYFIFPKQKARKEELMRQKIIDEMNKENSKK